MSSNHYFTLPEDMGSSIVIPVYFLYRTTSSQREDIIKTLSSPSTPLPESVKPKQLAAVPWLRNYTPSEDAVFDIIRDPGFPTILIDEKGWKEGTCIIGHGIKVPENNTGFKGEFAKVPVERVLYLVSVASFDTSWFPDEIEEGFRFERKEGDFGGLLKGMEELNLKRKETEWEWPEHLPKDLKLKESEPTIVSLIHLTESEIERISSAIGSSTEHGSVKIINWPADREPATNADAWFVFDRIKPDWPLPCGQVFGFFIDTNIITSADREPYLLMYSRRLFQTTNPASEERREVQYKHKTMSGGRIQRGKFFEAWNIAWHPDVRGTTDGVAINDRMRRASLSNHYAPGFWFITHPDYAFINSHVDIPIFVLQPITPIQEHKLRDALQGEIVSQFLHVPDGDGTLDSLMRYLQSAEFMRWRDRPPQDFLAIDKMAISTIEASQSHSSEGGSSSTSPSIILATSAMVWHETESGELAKDEVGYRVGRALLRDSDTYMMWSSSASQAMGLEGYMDDGVEGEGGLVKGKYYWDCFDEDDEELEELVTTME